MRHLYLTILLLVYGLCQSQTPIPKTRLSPEEAQEDLIFLYKTLRESHYDLFSNTERQVFEKHFKDLLFANTNDSIDLFDFHKDVQRFTAIAGHAHCNSGYPFQSGYGSYLESGGTLFPLDIYMDEGKIYVKKNYATEIEAPIGYEILEINKVPIASVMEEIYTYVSGENMYLKNSLIDLVEFSRLYWLAYGKSSSFKLKLRSPEKAITLLEVDAVLASEMEANYEKKDPLFDYSREFYLLEDIAYLRPGIFLNQEAEINTSEHSTFDRGEFITFIDSSFQEIIQNDLPHLVIDLRGNPGGDNSFSDYMLSYFAHQPFWFCSQFLVRTSETTKKFWRDVEMENLQDMRRQIMSLENGEQFEASFEDYQPKPDSLRYKGKVYVLIDRYSFSNTVATAAIVKDYGFGTILGEITADTPTSFGAVHQFNLPHSQIAITYPKALIVRPNGSKVRIGVRPDVPLKEIRGNGRDDVLAQTLDFIRKKAN